MSAGSDDERSTRISNRPPAPVDGHTKRSEETAPISLADGDAPSPALDTERYTAHEEIGRGGSSIVIRAFDNEIMRFVAVKILATETSEDTLRVDRFASEARITGQLEHPNIVPVYELDRDRRQRWFLAMKLVQGETLEAMLTRLGDARLQPRHIADLLQIFVKVCDAVSFAHSRGVIHRDLKPRNIMISEFGQVYVLDWGIARVRPSKAGDQGSPVRVSHEPTGTVDFEPLGLQVGTHGYMAPEQFRGAHGDVDERTDVFALGAVLYEILGGRLPMTPAIAAALTAREPPPPIIPPDAVLSATKPPPELGRIAMRALAYEPARRYQTVADFKADIESFQRGAWDLPQVRYRAGDTIVTEGDDGDAAYVILEGRCVACRRHGDTEIQLRVMEAGDVFGETAIFSRKPRSASVRALTDTVLLKVTEDVLSRALGLNSWMGGFVRALADRFREADQRLHGDKT